MNDEVCIMEIGKRHKSKNISNQNVGVWFHICRLNTWIILAYEGVSSYLMDEEVSLFLEKSIIRNLNDLMENRVDIDMKDKIITAVEKSLGELYAEVKDTKDEICDQGITLKLVVLQNNIAHILRCGNGRIATVIKNDDSKKTEIKIIDESFCSGTEIGEVFPFFIKEKWKYLEVDNCIGAFTLTDGLYNAISKNGCRKYGYTYEPGLVIPLIDYRCHKNRKSYVKYVKKMLKGTLKKYQYIKAIKKYYCIYKKSAKDELDAFNKYDIYRKFLEKATEDFAILGIMLENPKYEYAEL